MEHLGTGAGLAAIGFWGFIAAIVIAGVWSGIRKRESQHETLRRIVESGQPIDAALTDKLLAMTSNSQETARDLKVGGYITLAVAPGLSLMGWVMSLTLAEELFPVLFSVSLLLVCISGGMFLGARVAQKSVQAASS